MELPGITSLHRRDNPAIQVQPGEDADGADSGALATAAGELAAFPGITLPEVSEGLAFMPAKAVLAST